MDTSKIKFFWYKIIGSKEEFELNSRIFHYICFFGMLALLVNIPLNHFIGFPILTVAIILVLLGVFVSYYISRFLHRYSLAILMFEIISIGLAVLHFFYSSGINGAGLLYFLLVFFLTITIIPRKQYFFWLVVNLILVIGALLVEYKFPYLVKNQYESRIDRFYDLFIAYFITLILLVLLIREIWKNYFLEKYAYENKAKELAKLNEEKNKLFSIVAHDLRSPLLSIQNYLESLTSISFTEEEKNVINQKLLENTVAANEMMDNLLTWVKTQLNGVEANLVRFHLYENLKTTIDLCENLAENKKINLSVDIDDSVAIMADKEMIKVVMRNLIVNAIKFTSTGGYVIVKAENVNDKCIIQITDNGIGFSTQDQKDVFSHRLRSKIGTKNEKGTALGLIICRDYTLLQNGKIAMESKEGTGTTFILTFSA